MVLSQWTYAFRTHDFPPSGHSCCLKNRYAGGFIFSRPWHDDDCWYNVSQAFLTAGFQTLVPIQMSVHERVSRQEHSFTTKKLALLASITKRIWHKGCSSLLNNDQKGPSLTSTQMKSFRKAAQFPRASYPRYHHHHHHHRHSSWYQGSTPSSPTFLLGRCHTE